ETVLYSAPADAMTGFEMGYLFGEGSTEMWGASGFTYRTDAADAASDPRKSAIATVYSRCARLTIQKLIGTRENPGLLAWDPQLGQWTGDVEEPDFNRGVWEAGEGPGGYSAEINVRGRLIYGYNWRVAQLHPVDTAGDYRLTFSVDDLGGPDATPAHCDVAPNTDLSAATLLPGGGEGRGAVPAIDALNNLTYIDVRILPGDGGSGGGGGGSGDGGCQGGGSGGGHGGAGGGGCQDGGGGGDAHDSGEEEEQNPIRDADGDLVDRADIETGSAGASRPSIGLVSNTAIVAYEETKGSGGGQGGGPGGEAAGKFVRYHQFKPFYMPPTDEAAKVGCIVSDHQENGRRVRLVTQGQAGASGLRWAIFWRQGIGGQGASADIVLRRGDGNFLPTNLSPAVDPGCTTSVYEEAIGLDNADPLNVSSNTAIATDANLADVTGANSVENARAHRALLRGDDLYVGYTYTEDDALAQLARPRANYNFWMRRFDAAAGNDGTWMAPKNLSGISNLNVDAKEPRLMGTPGDGPNCPDHPEDCRDTSVFFAAWGTERKNPVTGAAEDLDIFVTCTTDKGEDFVPAIRIARGDNVNGQAEDQLRSTPDGSRVFSVWNQQDRAGAVDTRFTVGTLERSLGAPGGP
ncbi:MAG: choice-of-anchor O protein, partial [Desulfobacterales bacterium]